MAEKAGAAHDSAGANGIPAADKLRFFSEHVRGVLTLSSAAVPAIVGVFGLLFRRDATGNEVLPAFAKSWLILPALAVLSFLISILAGVAYSYYLCQKTDQMEIRVPKLDLASMALHVFFAIGVLLFSAWAFLMIFELR
jgi:ABC-type proline/glycine betaine transport system permease subunit